MKEEDRDMVKRSNCRLHLTLHVSDVYKIYGEEYIQTSIPAI